MPKDASATYYGAPVDRYYKSNFGFNRLPQVRHLSRASDAEMVMLGCIASKMQCKALDEQNTFHINV